MLKKLLSALFSFKGLIVVILLIVLGMVFFSYLSIKKTGGTAHLMMQVTSVKKLPSVTYEVEANGFNQRLDVILSPDGSETCYIVNSTKGTGLHCKPDNGEAYRKAKKEGSGILGKLLN